MLHSEIVIDLGPGHCFNTGQGFLGKRDSNTTSKHPLGRSESDQVMKAHHGGVSTRGGAHRERLLSFVLPSWVELYDHQLAMLPEVLFFQLRWSPYKSA